MQQELPQSYSERRKSAAEFICKTAFYTIPRFGVSAILFLCIGLFFTFPACHTFSQLREEKLVSWEMIGSTSDENIDLEKLLSIDGIERISPVIQFDAEIQFDEFKLNCQVQAVHCNFLDITILEGAMYSDNSNMPFLLLNKAAAESFAVQDNKKVTVTAGTNVTMKVNEDTASALICGIFEDGKKTPMVYMSFDLASKIFSNQLGVNLIFALSNKGDIEQVVSALQRKGVSVTYDQNEIARWELISQQAWQSFLTSIGFLFCATVLMRNWNFQDDKMRSGENYALALSGLTTWQIRWIGLLRLLLLDIISLIAVCGISWLIGMFSFLAVIICTISLCFQFVFSFLMKCQTYK